MIEPERLNALLGRFPELRIAVIGDFFLDRYLDIDGALRETSLETGLEARQVVAVRNYPGAAGTVTNNLAALGVGEMQAVGAIGDDGEGFELRRELEHTGVRLGALIRSSELYTPTYSKPMLEEPGKAPRELERLDIKNRRPLPAAVEASILARLPEIAAEADGIIVCDQVGEENYGVITGRVRDELARLGGQYPAKPILADSRARIASFRHVIIKPNWRETLRSAGLSESDEAALISAGAALTRRTRRPVFVTAAEQGIHVFGAGDRAWIPAYRPQVEIDPVGAGDSVAASIVAALCSGAKPREAALIGSLAGSVTIEQIGVTGVVTPAALRRRLVEYRDQLEQDA